MERFEYEMSIRTRDLQACRLPVPALRSTGFQVAAVLLAGLLMFLLMELEVDSCAAVFCCLP